MELPHLPSEQITTQLEAQGLIDNALNLYSDVVVRANDAKQVAARCREYLELPPKSHILQNKPLRKSMYFLIFNQKILQHSKIEIYWDVVTHFGTNNHKACIEYLQSAPKSVPLKLGRLLLFKSEFGSNLSEQHFRIIVSIFFSIPAIVEAVVSPEWKRQLIQNKGLNKPETSILLELAEQYRLDGPVHSLTSLFPQISAVEANAVLQKTGLSLEQATQNVLDDPNYVTKVLHPPTSAAAPRQNSKKQRPTYVDLDDQERKAREEKIRTQSKKNFVYQYTPLEDIDPEPEDDDAGLQSELSEADKKLASQEQLLWAQWEQNKEVFSRESRKSSARTKLKAALNWTDEQIEGWGKFTGSKGRNGEANLAPRNAQEVASYAPSATKFNEKNTNVVSMNDTEKRNPSKGDTAKHDNARQNTAKHNATRQTPAKQNPEKQSATKRAKGETSNTGKHKDAKPKSKPDRSRKSNKQHSDI